MTVPRRPRAKQLLSTTLPEDIELTWPDNDVEGEPPALTSGTSHCPTCTCQQFDTRASRILDLIVDLHEALGTATAQVSAVRTVLEEEVLP